jgi:hypothetical protein
MAAEDSLSIVRTGAVIAFTGTTASVAIPTDSSGAAPKYVRLAATAACYVQLGDASVTAVAGGVLVQPADSIILKTSRLTYVSAIQVTTGGTLQISPLEDQ